MLEGEVLVAGEAAGPALVLSEPLSFWGGVDPATGRIVDEHHDRRGEVVARRVLVMPSGRGSSSSSSVIVECVGAGTAPAAFLLLERDEIVVVGAIVAEELFGTVLPVLRIDRDALARLADGVHLTIDRQGKIELD